MQYVKNKGYTLETYGALSVPDTGASLDIQGRNYLIKNIGTDTVYLGSDDSVSTSNGFALLQGDSILVSNKIYFTVAATKTGDIRYVQVR